MYTVIKKHKTILLSAVWSYLALLGLVYYLEIGMESRNYSNNLVYALLYIMIAAFILKSRQYMDRRKLKFSVFFSALTALIFVAGAQLEYLAAISWTAATAGKVLLLAVFFIPVYVLLFHLCTGIEVKAAEWSTDRWKKWKIYLIIVFFWGLAYLALFPGIYDYDSIDQTRQFLVSGYITSHHPVIHSFLLSTFLQIGHTLLGSYEAGLGFYSLLQLLFLAYAAVSVSWHLLKKQKKYLFVLSLIFYALFPVHSIMAVWAAKDTIFAGLFALVSLSLLEMTDQDSDFFQNKRAMVRFVILTVLMCMFRNNGIYALILMLPVCFFCFKRGRWKVTALVAVCAVLYLSYQNVLLPAAGVVSGDMREMLSVPCQQLAKVYVEAPEVFDEEEKEALLELIPEEHLLDYEDSPMIADATKNYFNSEVFRSSPGKYVKMYLEIGLKSPGRYVEAFLTNSLGFWYPNKSYPDSRMFHPYTEFDMADPDLFGGDYIYLKRISLLPPYEFILRMIIQYTAWEYFPVISNFFVPGTYFLLLLFAAGTACYRKTYSRLLVLGFWAGLWFTLLISPVALVRYAYPVILCLPILGELIVPEKKAGSECLPENQEKEKGR